MTSTVQTTAHQIEFRNRDPLIRALSNGLLFAGKDGTVPAITTIKFEFDGTDLKTISTDKYRLCVEKIEHKTPEHEDDMTPAPAREPFAFLLQTSDAKTLLGTLKAASVFDPIELSYEPDSQAVRLRTPNSTAEVHTDVDHAFPNYAPLIPARDDRVAVDEIGFNPKWLTDLGKVHTDGRLAGVRIKLYGAAKPARVDFENGPTLVVMPFRVGDDDSWGAV